MTDLRNDRVCSQDLVQHGDKSCAPNVTAPRKLRGRRWPVLTVGIAIVFLMGHVAGAYQKEVVQARLQATTVIAGQFEVRGADNKLRASLTHDASGLVWLSFYDPAGKARLTLSVAANGSPSISMADDKGSQRMSLALLGEDATPQLMFFNPGGDDAVVSLGIIEGVGPSLTLGKIGQSQISLLIGPNGEPVFSLRNEDGKPRLELSVSGDEPAVSLIGPAGVPRARWYVLPDGSSAFALVDSRKNERLVIATDKDGRPSIRFIDATKAIFKEFK